MKLLVTIKIIICLFFLNINIINAQNVDDTISKVIIEGNQRVEYDTVISYVNLSSGDLFDPDKLNRALKSLFSTGFFF